jgi:hypothetical protein
VTEQAYPGLSKAEEIFKDLIWDNAIEAALVALFAAAPYLAVPPLKTIISGIIRLVGDTFFKYIRLIVDVNAISLVNKQHQANFEAISVKLRVLAYQKGIESNEFKKAKAEAKVAFAKFVKFGAS